MLKTTLICCRDSIYLLTSVVSGLVWVGLINVCVRSAASCVANSSEEILGNGGGGGCWEELCGVGDSLLSSLGGVGC